MPQSVQRRSYGSVTVFWLDRDAALDALTRAARRLSAGDPNVLSVRLFGSLAAGNATAASDADLMVVIADSDVPLLRRAERYTAWFAEVGMPVDLFVFTEREIATAPSAIAERALATGIVLAAAETG